jgi:hypothetical protein
MKTNAYCALLAGSLLLGAATVSAHHSISAEFDQNSLIEFTGTVKQVEWVNPHGFMQVDVTDDDGTVSTYRVQIGAPISLYRQGWRKESVPPGTVVHFTGIRAKNPNSRNVNGTVTGPDGSELWRGEGPDGSLQ